MVSVIIPVFNASEFLFNSVTSAIELKEVIEVILVEDGSTDNSLNVCLELEKTFDKVKVFSHEGGLNKGPSASRNLGIKKSTAPFVSFLDADDWYLPNRFLMDKKRFTELENIDAVYSCSIMDKYQGLRNKLYGVNSIKYSNLNPILMPIKFFEKVVRNKLVLFDTNSITFKKSFLQKFKLFDERLFLHQDIELWFRLMRKGTFVAGDWENPVSVYRRHPGNRITSKSRLSNLKMIQVYLDNLGIDNLLRFEIDDLYSRILRKKSQKFSNSMKRRVFFYFYYYIGFFNKKSVLEKFKSSYDID